MLGTYVELPELSVLRVRTDLRPGGPATAFALLESRLPSRKGRKFYGTFQVTSDGEVYYACVVRTPSDDPEKMGLETGTIPGGWYARRTLLDWEGHESEIHRIFFEMIKVETVDPSRPSVEFYRSRKELLLLLPVKLERFQG